MVMPLNMHTATAEELKTLHQIKDKRAQDILTLRGTTTLSPDTLAKNGILNIDYWHTLINDKIVTFDPPSKPTKIVTDAPGSAQITNIADQLLNITEKLKKLDSLVMLESKLDSYMSNTKSRFNQLAQSLEFSEQRSNENFRETEKKFSDIETQINELHKETNDRFRPLECDILRNSDAIREVDHGCRTVISDTRSEIDQAQHEMVCDIKHNKQHLDTLNSKLDGLREEVSQQKILRAIPQNSIFKYNSISSHELNSEGVKTENEPVKEESNAVNYDTITKQTTSKNGKSTPGDKARDRYSEPREIDKQKVRKGTIRDMYERDDRELADRGRRRERGRERRESDDSGNRSPPSHKSETFGSRSPPRPKLEKYRGEKNEKIEEFLFQFDRVAMRREWSSTHSAGRLLDCLRGVALEFANRLPRRTLKNYDTLSERLVQRFSYKMNPRTARKELGSIKQLEGESIEDFSQKVASMAMDGYTNMDQEPLDELSVEAFLRGLTDKQAARQVLEKNPTNIGYALKLLKEHQANNKAIFGTTNMKSYHQRNVTFSGVTDIDEQIKESINKYLEQSFRKFSNTDTQADTEHQPARYRSLSPQSPGRGNPHFDRSGSPDKFNFQGQSQPQKFDRSPVRSRSPGYYPQQNYPRYSNAPQNSQRARSPSFQDRNSTGTRQPQYQRSRSPERYNNSNYTQQPQQFGRNNMPPPGPPRNRSRSPPNQQWSAHTAQTQSPVTVTDRPAPPSTTQQNYSVPLNGQELSN